MLRERTGAGAGAGRSSAAVGVGFGIRDAETAARIAGLADAVVIGSRIIEEIEQSSREEAPAKVAAFLRGIRNAIDNAGER